ncbi:hypothetical protein Tco_0520797 [Tanacetum coccineum]
MLVLAESSEQTICQCCSCLLCWELRVSAGQVVDSGKTYAHWVLQSGGRLVDYVEWDASWGTLLFLEELDVTGAGARTVQDESANVLYGVDSFTMRSLLQCVGVLRLWRLPGEMEHICRVCKGDGDLKCILFDRKGVCTQVTIVRFISCEYVMYGTRCE